MNVAAELREVSDQSHVCRDAGTIVGLAQGRDLTNRSPWEAPLCGNTLCSKSRGEFGLQTSGCDRTVENGVRSMSFLLSGSTESLLPSSAFSGACFSNSSEAFLPCRPPRSQTSLIL